MARSLIVLLFSLLSLNGIAQFHYTIDSSPDSAIVTVNGEEECVTPCRVKYYWKDKKNRMMVFSVSANGYDSWSDTIFSKPSDFSKSKNVDLVPSVSKLQFDSINPLIGFDKLLASFEDGQQVGSFTDEEGKVEPIKWEGSVKVGNSAFEKKFYSRMTNYGFETPVSKGTQLFAEDENQRLLPKFVVGAQLLELDISINHSTDKSYGAGQYIAKIRLKIEWKVLDKSTDKVVYTFINEGTIRQRENQSLVSRDITMSAFELALIDFAERSEFHELVRSAKIAWIDQHLEGEQKIINIPLVENPSFAKISEMILYSSKSCVTVVTDAGHGSGVIVSKDGYIITAYHVIKDVNKIVVKLSTGIELSAQLLVSNFENDVALLKVDGSGFQPLSISDEIVGLGEEVITIGTPADIELGQSVSKGMISGRRLVEGKEFIQIDMSVSPGNSGGPLLDGNGKIVGIVQKKLVGSGIEGIGFAIPILKALEVLGLVLNN